MEQESGATPETPMHSETKHGDFFLSLDLSFHTDERRGLDSITKESSGPKTPDRRKNWTEAWTGVRVGSLTPVCSPCETDVRSGGEAAVTKSLA